MLAKDGSRLMENLIHLLQTAVGRLREEEVDRRHHECVNDCKNDIGLVSNVCKGGRRDHDNHEVEDPVRGCGDGVCGSSDIQRGDFGGVEPGHAEPTDGEEGVEHEEEHSLVEPLELHCV